MDKALVWLCISSVLLATGITTVTVGCGIDAKVTMTDGKERTTRELGTLALESSMVDSVEISCRNTDSQYRIFHDGRQVFQGRTGDHYEVDGFGVEYQGQYRCECRDGSNTLNLVVIPGLQDNMFTGTAVEGDTVQLPCQLTNTHHGLEQAGLYVVQWKKGNYEVVGERYTKEINNSLTIADFSEEDTEFEYTCFIRQIGSDDFLGNYPHSGPRRLRLLEEPNAEILTSGNGRVSCSATSPPANAQFCLTITFFGKDQFKECDVTDSEVKTTAQGNINTITCEVTFYSNASDSSLMNSAMQMGLGPNSPVIGVTELSSTLPLVIVTLIVVAVLIIVLLGCYVFRRRRRGRCEQKDEEQNATSGASPGNDGATTTEGPDGPMVDCSNTRPPIPGDSAPSSLVAPQTASGTTWALSIPLNRMSKKVGRERRPASPAESIHDYHAPLQCSIKPRPTYLKCNFMRYSDHTLPSPPVTTVQTAVFPSVVVQCRDSTVAAVQVDKLWPRTPPSNWSAPGSRVSTPLAVTYKAQPLLLQTQSSIAEGSSPRIEELSQEDQDMRIQRNEVAMMVQAPPSSCNGDDSAMETSSSASSIQQGSPQLSPESTSAQLQLTH